MHYIHIFIVFITYPGFEMRFKNIGKKAVAIAAVSAMTLFSAYFMGCDSKPLPCDKYKKNVVVLDSMSPAQKLKESRKEADTTRISKSKALDLDSIPKPKNYSSLSEEKKEEVNELLSVYAQKVNECNEYYDNRFSEEAQKLKEKYNLSMDADKIAAEFYDFSVYLLNIDDTYPIVNSAEQDLPSFSLEKYPEILNKYRGLLSSVGVKVSDFKTQKEVLEEFLDIETLRKNRLSVLDTYYGLVI